MRRPIGCVSDRANDPSWPHSARRRHAQDEAELQKFAWVDLSQTLTLRRVLSASQPAWRAWSRIAYTTTNSRSSRVKLDVESGNKIVAHEWTNKIEVRASTGEKIFRPHGDF